MMTLLIPHFFCYCVLFFSLVATARDTRTANVWSVRCTMIITTISLLGLVFSVYRPTEFYCLAAILTPSTCRDIQAARFLMGIRLLHGVCGSRRFVSFRCACLTTTC